MDRRSLLVGAVSFIVVPCSRVLTQECPAGTNVYFLVPSQDGAPAESLFAGATYASEILENICDAAVIFVQTAGEYDSTFAAIRAISEESEDAVIVGAFGEAIAAKYASMNPNHVFVDLLSQDERHYKTVPNVFYLPPQSVSTESGWQADLFDQGVAAVDFSLAIAGQKNIDMQSGAEVHLGAPGNRMAAQFNEYQVNPYSNEVYTIPGFQ